MIIIPFFSLSINIIFLSFCSAKFFDILVVPSPLSIAILTQNVHIIYCGTLPPPPPLTGSNDDTPTTVVPTRTQACKPKINDDGRGGKSILIGLSHLGQPNQSLPATNSPGRVIRGIQTVSLRGEMHSHTRHTLLNCKHGTTCAHNMYVCTTPRHAR